MQELLCYEKKQLPEEYFFFPKASGIEHSCMGEFRDMGIPARVAGTSRAGIPMSLYSPIHLKIFLYESLRGNVISTTVLSINQGVRTKFYQIIDGNVISTTRNASTGLSTTIVGKTSVLSTTT
jgi:hypothetical protein